MKNITNAAKSIPSLIKYLLVVVPIVFLLIYLMMNRRKQSPYPDIIFIEDFPGATSRHVSFTPVMKEDPSVQVGPVASADFGRLRFQDLDGDGTQEAIIETKKPFIDSGEFYSDTRTVLRYIHDAEGKSRMEEITHQ